MTEITHPPDSRPVSVAVIGQGIIGLSCAHELARRGMNVTVIAADNVEDTVSFVAAALWFPFHAFPVDKVWEWSLASLDTYLRLAGDPSTGVHLRTGYVVHRTPDPDLSWTDYISDCRDALPEEVPDGALSATVCRLPIIETRKYLPWLRNECALYDVSFEKRRISSIDEVGDEYDAIVVATGLGSGELVGDPTVHPVRGQVVRLQNHGLKNWYLDNGPDALTYIIPRATDIVCGGTAQPWDGNTRIDPTTEEAILNRASALVPLLAELPTVSNAVGLRPGRPEVRLELSATASGRPVIYNYGHGGAGVTVAWGCASETEALLTEALAQRGAAPLVPSVQRD